mgnify:CR=1 FL=1
MNKIKNIYRSLILLLSLVLMPVEGWASDGYFAGTTPIVIKLSDYIMDHYDYACFYFDRNGSKLDISGWNIKNDRSLDHEITGYDWAGHAKDNNYVFYKKSEAIFGTSVPLFQYQVNSNSENLHQTKLVLLLSNDAELLNQKENLADVKKMEFDLYTEDGLKSSKVTYGSNSADFSKAESTSIIPTAATSISVTLPDYNAKYLRWQLFDSETATTPVTTITNILSNSSSVEKGSDLVYFNTADVANEAARTVTFDFKKLPSGADVEKYVLKCTWAKNNDDAKVVTCNGTDYIIQEPTLNGEYTFKFVKQATVDATSLVLSADNVDAAHTHQVDAIYTDGKLEVSLKDVVPEILSDFGVADKKDVSDFYMRWVLADKDGKILSATSSNSALALRKTSDGKEYYTLLSKKGSSLLPTGLNVTFGLPSGFLWSSDMKVYCLLTNDLTGHEAQYGVITKEPSAFKSRINVKLYSPADLPFKHYEGIANKKGEWDKVNGHTYQKTHEWEYYYYVDGNETNQRVMLDLPFQYYEGSGNKLEPRGYFRWYNYNTDRESDHLVTCGDATTPTKLSTKGNWGLFANNIGDNPTSTRIGVYYKTSHVTDSWTGETIACDVSRYVDGMDASRTYLLHEPTLSIRYIFHILPKKKLADDIKAALCNHPDGDYTYEDNKKVTFGFKDENSVTTLRLQLNDISRYSFYPMTSDGLKKVVYNNDITDADFDMTNYVSAQKYTSFVEWRVYDITKTKYCKFTENNRFLDLSVKKLNDADWYNSDGSSVDAAAKPVIGKGIPVYVVAYLKAQEQMCPVANFDVRFMEFHPMSHKQITDEGYNNRAISYLDEHYKLATKPISFDDDDEEQTLSKPTTPDDNQDRLPSRWDRRAYSFVYRDLMKYDAAVTGYAGIEHSPLHGDYGLYKTANLSGISGNGGTDKYVWWTDKTLYDRTYEMTNGSQYGHFLYVDASDESRQIAAADFKADLCTGMQVIFSANVADMTHADELPQVMFKLYGVNYDAEGNIQSQKLLHSFSSGDFKNNTEDNPCLKATWYQVYGKIVIQKESGVENYSDFRVIIDNYCQNTEGADYAIDDIRIYIEPAKVQVIQDRPACGNAATGNIKLKIRAVHETLNAILNHTDTKIYFKFVDEEGNSVKGDGFYSYNLRDDAGNSSTVTGSDYGTVDVYDSEETCRKYYIDDTPMIEQDSEGETYIVISNKYFPLTVGKKYYVSVATEDPESGKANWGSPAEVCSLYSSWFEMVSQNPIITDAKGNVVTDYKIPCDKADNYEVTIKGQLTTTDPNTGGKITLDGVNFIWYIDGTGEANKVDPSAAASNEITISKDRLPLGETHKIYMKPEGTPNADGYIPYPLNGKTYLLCTSVIPVPLRVMKDGPQLNFGFNDVDYPFNDGSYAASLRIGLPQLKKLQNTGFLEIPLHSATTGDGKAITSPLTFVDDSGTSAFTSDKVMVASTNDPSWKDKLNTQVATLQSKELPAIDKTTQATLNLKFSDAALENFHEGYYYELRFAFEQRKASEATTNCAGESYLKLKIVPEFVTWTPTADGGMNANWNNDDNWHRSSSTELYDNEYPNYQAYGNASGITAKIDIPTQNSYVPMKFTKVTIGNLNGLPFPDLGNVVYRSTNQIATKLTNGKGNEATKYIQYDIMAIWNEADANKGFEADGNLKCEKFYGNTCHQIYFKPQGELRDQCYLIYDKAWVEKELVPNKWYTMASPLQYIYAGDMYVPASDGQQTTKAFTDITFDTDAYSRSKYPVYQRAWMKSDVKEITPNGEYSASHYPGESAPSDVDMNLGYWSHVYNKVDESYSDAADGTSGGFSIKAGNALLPKDKTKKALLRLPKADTEYQYFDYNGTGNSSSTQVTKDSKGHGKLLVAFNNDEKHLAEKTQSLGDNTSGFYLVANPYTCSISMAKFFEANTGLQKAIWMVENGEVKAISGTELDMKNYAIQPTQSFFVKKNAGATIGEVRFTSAMYVDRTITPGLLMASDYVKSIEATTENSSGQTSKARIALRPEASADYDDQEDVDLLYDQNLKDVPLVYTVAGNEAVAVNAVPELSWIPLGIVSQQAEEVSLTLNGVNKLDAPVYLYDAASASFTELHEGEAVKVKAGDHGRYFLTQTRTTTGIDRIEAEEQSAPVKVYSPAAGMIVVTALGGEKLDRVQVFTMDGKMVHSYQLPAKQRMILRVTSGIYIVKASTQSCAQAKGQKISVR